MGQGSILSSFVELFKQIINDYDCRRIFFLRGQNGTWDRDAYYAIVKVLGAGCVKTLVWGRGGSNIVCATGNGDERAIYGSRGLRG